MKNLLRVLFASALSIACDKNVTPVDAPVSSAPVVVSAPAVVASAPAVDPVASAPPIASSAPALVASAPTSFPPIDVACAKDDDCTSTGQWGDCCGACEQKYANKSYVARAQAYCKAHPPTQCPPMGCSWGMSKPQCRGGRCQAWK